MMEQLKTKLLRYLLNMILIWILGSLQLMFVFISKKVLWKSKMIAVKSEKLNEFILFLLNFVIKIINDDTVMYRSLFLNLFIPIFLSTYWAQFMIFCFL